MTPALAFVVVGKIHTMKSLRSGVLGREQWKCGLPGTGQN